MPRKIYLGDSVYAEYDGFAITLTTNNGYPDDPRNKIVLEPEVFSVLFKWLENLGLTPKSQCNMEWLSEALNSGDGVYRP